MADQEEVCSETENELSFDELHEIFDELVMEFQKLKSKHKDLKKQNLELDKINNNLYRSAQPTKQGMNNLKNIGVKTIINLRAFHSDKDETGNTGLFNEEISVNTWYIKDKDVIRVLRIVLKKQNGPILIHCQHGADRTGIMIAMYRIVEQGWSKDEAIREMVDGGYGFHSIWSNAIDYVKNVDIEKFKDEVTWLQEKPVQATKSLPRDIGSAKSYLIPALEEI